MRKVIFAIEILAVILVVGGLYYYEQLTSRLETIVETPEATVNDDGVLQSEPLQNDNIPVLTGYKTIALFGIDHRDFNEALSGENSDTMIIAVIDNDNQEIRLVSVYRDTLLDIGDDIFAKANAAYAYGGAKQALTMLNTNLDLNISEYVTIDFNALTAAVDAVGGLDIPLSYAEMVHMNNYCIEVSEETGRDYTPVELPEEEPEDLEAIVGTFHLNGVQVTSYCRIRYTANLDMGRTERQRYVIQLLMHKAKSAGITKSFEIMDEIFPMVKTNMTVTEILNIAPALIGYDIGQTSGFPMDFRFSEVKNSVIVPTDLVSNVSKLHDFLYGNKNYKPTADVTRRSGTIETIVSGSESSGDYSQGSGGSEDDDYNFLWRPDDEGNYSYYAPTPAATDYSSGTSGYTETISGDSSSSGTETGGDTWTDANASSDGGSSSGDSMQDTSGGSSVDTSDYSSVDTSGYSSGGDTASDYVPDTAPVVETSGGGDAPVETGTAYTAPSDSGTGGGELTDGVSDAGV